MQKRILAIPAQYDQELCECEKARKSFNRDIEKIIN